jgi:hypothetical protein
LATCAKPAAKAARGVRALKREVFALIVPLLDDMQNATPHALAEGIVLGLHVFTTSRPMKEQQNTDAKSIPSLC